MRRMPPDPAELARRIATRLRALAAEFDAEADAIEAHGRAWNQRIEAIDWARVSQNTGFRRRDIEDESRRPAPFGGPGLTMRLAA